MAVRYINVKNVDIGIDAAEVLAEAHKVCRPYREFGNQTIARQVINPAG
jgi:hypothetical protein